MSLNKSKFLEQTELALLRSNLRLDVRDEVIILLAIETGARASEILHLSQPDFFDSSKSILIRGLKGSKSREMPLREDLYHAAKRFVPFGIGYPRLHQIWCKYKPVDKKFHSLRHTFALELYRKHRDVYLVKTALGHKSINNTQIYVDYLYNTEELRKLLL
jgi:integrase